ncbi:MAG: DUF3105 domain-containing protein [Patescibacteria group bacterium]
MSSSAIKTYWWIGAIIILIIGIIWWGISSPSDYEELGEKIPIMGNNHISLSSPHEPYNSNPPTSGPHTGKDADWGAHQDEISDEVAIHNLEHGGIWITYQDKNDQDLKNKMEELARQYQSKILLSPRAKNDSPIALSAWGRLLKLSAFDEIKIKKFIRQYKNKGPEFIPD